MFLFNTFLDWRKFMAKVQVNQKAPDFQLKDFKGDQVRLSQFTGAKNVLIVFNRGFT
jgi:peroxiredoxin